MGYLNSNMQHQSKSSKRIMAVSWPVGRRRWGTKQTKASADDSKSSKQKPLLVTCDEDPQSKEDNDRDRGTSSSRSLIKRCINQGRRINLLSLLDPYSINDKPCYQESESLIHQTYKILPKVQGEGTAGQVRQCLHLPTFTMCAVKTISKSHTKRKDRIEREISILKEVKHPNILQVYDVYEEKDEVHIVTELCQGGELFDKVVEKASEAQKQKEHNKKKNKKKPRRNSKKQVAAVVEASSTSTPTPPVLPACFSEEEAARIIHSLLSAVSYLHSKDIVHRDIKPENILFKSKEEGSPIKLIDFGLSIRHTSQCRKLSSSVGTAFYMAPEVIKSTYDRSCDLWSVGIVAYVLLCGRPPFTGETNEDIFENIKKGQYTTTTEEGLNFWDTGVSKEAKEFIHALLDFDPKKRWTADRALEHVWLESASAN